MSDFDESLRPLARLQSGWTLRWHPDAGEAGGCFVSARRRSTNRGVPGQAVDPERARVEAGRRARGQLRRYCAANRLNRLGTLTYAGEGCHDPVEVRAHVGMFFRELRGLVGGAAFPYAWVPEWHKTGHGLHVHFAVGRFIQRSMIDSAWGRGFVHIKLLGDLPAGSGNLAQARVAAGYLSKYVAKSFGESRRPAGLHRFDVAQGFQPRAVRLTGRSSDDVLMQACERAGALPAHLWSSDQVEGWQGPPAVWFQWA